MIRAIFRAVKVKDIEPPFDTLLLKIFYPALAPQDEIEKNSGILAPDVSKSPFPVVIFLNGVNCPPESYQWLAEFLCQEGFVFVTFNWITDALPGDIAGLTPGIDMRFMTFENYGKAPTGTAIQPILDDLKMLDTENLLGGLLDLDNVHLGGHSAGGSVALTNANPQFFASIKSVFAYAAHTQGSTMLGFPPDSVLPISAEIPVLMMGGNRDGVITWSARRYGKTEGDPVLPLKQTFDKAISGKRGDRFLIIFDGANHFTFAHPQDATTGRPFLDNPAPENEADIRNLMAEIILEFLQTRKLRERNDEKIAIFERK